MDSEIPNRILIVANSERGSATWNFLWDCKFIITNHISSHIDNDRSAKFWWDSWDGAPTLSEIISDNDWINLVESTYGMFVEDYFEQNRDMNGKRVWKQVNIGNPILCDRLWEVLKSRFILVSNDEDKILGCVSKSVDYNVKLGYEVQRQRGMCLDWPYKLYWSNKLLPKAGAI